MRPLPCSPLWKSISCGNYSFFFGSDFIYIFFFVFFFFFILRDTFAYSILLLLFTVRIFSAL